MEQSLRHTERNMRCRLRVITSCAIAGILFVVFATTVNAATTTPTTMNFQGRLTTNTGAAVADGLYNVKFAIYDDPTAGSVQWTETRETTNRVQVTNGLFSTQLGAVTPLPASVFSAAGRYFEVTMATPATANCSTASCATWEAAMTPRSTIATSAYAYNSETLDGLDSADFIRNQNASAQTSTNLWIDGTARAATIQAANGVIVPGTNNENVFTVQNAGTAPVFNVDTTNGEVELGSASLAGKLVISDGSSNKVTLVAGPMSGDYTLTLPTAVGASGDCLKTSDTSGTLIFGGCSAGGGVTTVGALDGGTANANGTTISGSTIYLQSASASYAGLVNTSTQTFAGAKTFDDSLTLAAAKTITMVGGNFGSRPGSPAEGTLYYDTDSHQMIQWNGTKWVNNGSDSYLVAASNSSQADKDAADYVADGTADQTEINNALDRADPGSAISGARKSGKVYLFAGTYTTSDVISIPNDTTLAGAGRGSVIKFANINGQTKNMITNTDTSTGTGVTVRDLHLDGSKSVNTSGTMYGMYFNGMGGGAGSTARQGANIINNWVNDFFSNGIYFINSPNSTIIGNNVQGNSGNGIYISTSNRSNITNNISQGNGGSGIVLGGAVSENVVANTITGNGTAGIYLNGGSNNNTIFGNNLYNNGGNTANNSILFATSGNADFNTVTNNTINDTSGTTTNYAINFADTTSNNNYLADNVFTSTAGTSTINDAAANATVYANQSRAEGGGKLTNRTVNDTEAFGIQNASGAAIFVVDTVNAEVEIGSSAVAGKIVVSDGSSNTATIGTGALAGNYTVNIPTITGNDFFCLQNLGNCAGGGATLQTAYNGDASGVADIVTTSAAKTILFKAGATFDAAALFDIQDAAGTSLFMVDSVNDRVYVGDNTADGAGTILVLDTKNTVGDPTGVDGAMYYDSNGKNFRCYKNGLWSDCNFASLRSEWMFQEDFAGGITSTGNIGNMSWVSTAAGSGTVTYVSVGAVAQNQDRFGVLQLNSTATNPSGISVRQNAGSMAGVRGDMVVEFDFAPLNAAAAAGLQQINRIGLHNSTGASAPSSGFYFQYVATTTTGNWFRCVQASCVDTGVARTTTANVYQRFRIQTNSAGTSVEFFINEASVGVVSSGLPGATSVYTPAYNVSGTDTSIRQWKTDYFQIKRNLTTLR